MNKTFQCLAISIIIIVSIMVSGCAKNGYNFSLVDSKSNKEKCHELAEDIIPKNVTLLYGDGILYLSPLLDNQFWNDGTHYTGSTILFSAGSSEGQNINYYYLYCYYGTCSPISYSKQIIDKDGNVLGTRSFSFRPIIKPIPGTESYGKDYALTPPKYQQFGIINLTFDSCRWVMDDGTVIE